MEFKPHRVSPGFAERSSKMYILPALTYLEVGGPAAASEIICFEHFKWEPIWPFGRGPKKKVGKSVGFCLGVIL